MSISELTMTAYSILDVLTARFGDEVKTNVVLAPYTSARIGGRADIVVEARNAEDLAQIVSLLWEEGIEPVVLGGGSNVLVSDKGIRGVTVINRAKDVRFDEGATPSVWAESGVVFSNLANRCALKGLAGLEWASTVPGTIGGAVYGNAGAFGGDMAGSLKWADVLTKAGRERWPVEYLGYGDRTSLLKRGEREGVVLSGELRLRASTQDEVSARMSAFGEQRKASQPPGASMGSMFKNPAGDKAGRLIEAAGLKGRRVGNVEISTIHANFFVNRGRANAADVKALIEVTQRTVKAKLGVDLELEIELIGEGMES
ncbi:MAG TPA: UDP-N-acetylmuramate dehydrogenase, partial [Anaerolineales bacterium]|nr:UDP-N-acetylmuramate dehydrogenase [Anaerolineales bacterium]